MSKRRYNYRSANDYDAMEASNAAALLGLPDGPGESLTIQSQAEDADINVLMQRFGVTGRMPENIRVPTYGDYSEVIDFRTALEAVRNAEDSFMEIPAKVRARFENDPQKFLEFAANPANIKEMREMGLAKPEKIDEPVQSADQDAGAKA